MKRVLLIDDHDLFRESLAVVLEHHTDLKENVQAGSLAEARQILDDLDSKADLAIVNLDLPEGEGTELIEYLHGIDVPVLAFTTDSSLERRARALQAGADELLSTASSVEEIIGTVKRLGST
jgi:DNA-binding NarL/FixJ family response regulator